MLTLATADSETAAHLRIAANAPVGNVRRVFRSPDGTVLYLGEVTYRGDLVQVETGSGAVTIAIATVAAQVCRCPVDTPVVTSFGTMRQRPMVLVRVPDPDGCEEWGEIWCNDPAVGAEHRARLVDDTMAVLFQGRSFADPADAFAYLTARTAILALQSGEPRYRAFKLSVCRIDRPAAALPKR